MACIGSVDTKDTGSFYPACLCMRMPECYRSDFGGIPGVLNLKSVGLVAIGR